MFRCLFNFHTLLHDFRDTVAYLFHNKDLHVESLEGQKGLQETMLKPGAVNVMLVKHTLRLSIVFYIRRREESFVAIQLPLPPISVLSNNVNDITSFEGQLSVISSFKFVKPSASTLKFSLGCYETKMRPGSLHSSACVTFRTHWSRSFINGGRCRCIGRIWCWKSQ